jgi:catechol 2,3-dioxygenase-like lactoylglutathione lyase family enzyme
MRVAIDHVQIAAPPGSEAEARRFFGGVLGLEEIAKPESLQGRGGVWFRVGDHQLHVGVDEAFIPARKAHLALRVAADELARVAVVLESAGVSVDWDDALPGTRRFYTTDPWGSRLEILAPD